MTTAHLLELDAPIIFLNENMPYPRYVKYRAGIYPFITFSLGYQAMVPSEELWIKQNNQALAPLLPRINADYVAKNFIRETFQAVSGAKCKTLYQIITFIFTGFLVAEVRCGAVRRIWPGSCHLLVADAARRRADSFDPDSETYTGAAGWQLFGRSQRRLRPPGVAPKDRSNSQDRSGAAVFGLVRF
jgi:hypothetical protein